MHRRGREFFFQVVALLLALIAVHALYVTLIRPNAELIERRAAERAAAEGTAYQPPRSLYVVLKDFEQEAAIVLALWALAVLAYKTRATLAERRLLERPLLPLAEGLRVLPEDVPPLLRGLEELSEEEREALPVRVLVVALTRFQVTRDVRAAEEAVDALCEAEGDRRDAELSLIRYITWAIPSIGFIGTVRGIGDALGQAHQAMQGDIAGVTASLGVAFNSTFVALVVSMFVMFFLHQLQLLEERLVLDARERCDRSLLRHLEPL
ncbi:MAG: hypothetical protein KatS3mg124_0575 [Porticoccaceae bacterium]|nr:MAG: hypothetical protein KatS3mg124_0575 [Porticoccaceae bacterium]